MVVIENSDIHVVSLELPLECVTDSFYCCSDGVFGGGAFDGECVGGGTGLGFLYAWHFLNGTDYGCLAMTAMHVLNAIDGHIGV